MKFSFLLVFLYLTCLFSYGDKLPSSNQTNLKIQNPSSTLKKRKNPVIKSNTDQQTIEEKTSFIPEGRDKKATEEAQLKPPPTELNTQQTTEEKQSKSSSIRSSLVAQKIKKVFIDFLEIIEKESLDSEEYKKAVKFLENSLYSDASFETLKLLATVYKEKKDSINQINVLNILSVSYSNNPESFYLLGQAYKNLYLLGKKDKKKKKKKEYEKNQENKEKSIESFNQAIRINRRYILAYRALLNLFMTENKEIGGKIHTKASLSVALDMLKTFKKSKYYIQLCKAYYDNNFFKQSRKACAISVQKNPNNPISPVILALSRKSKKDSNRELLETAKKFEKSFFVQYKTALFFRDKDPRVAMTYFNSAHALQPKNIKLNKIMANFLFDNKEEEKSYKHFLNTCLLTNGKFLKNFRLAKRELRGKKAELVPTFQKGIEKCFLSAKKKQKQ